MLLSQHAPKLCRCGHFYYSSLAADAYNKICIFSAFLPGLFPYMQYEKNPVLRGTFFLFFAAARVFFQCKLKSHKALIINRIYYRYFLHKLLAINEFNGIVCTVNGAVRSRPTEPVNSQTMEAQHDQQNYGNGEGTHLRDGTGVHQHQPGTGCQGDPQRGRRNDPAQRRDLR